ncbi:MAG TPA: transposase [Puia sp.]|nr:transposase [Puia sp.]
MVYLYAHVIWSVRGREALLSKAVRRVLFAQMPKESAEKGIKIVAIDGIDDHVHCLLQLMPSQNLSQVLKSIRASSMAWLNDTRLLPVEFVWEEDYYAYSVSPSGVKQVIDFIGKQEEYHKTKTLNDELEIFDKFKES